MSTNKKFHGMDGWILYVIVIGCSPSLGPLARLLPLPIYCSNPSIMLKNRALLSDFPYFFSQKNPPPNLNPIINTLPLKSSFATCHTFNFMDPSPNLLSLINNKSHSKSFNPILWGWILLTKSTC